MSTAECRDVATDEPTSTGQKRRPIVLRVAVDELHLDATGNLQRTPKKIVHSATG
jgi:hypothetical protein